MVCEQRCDEEGANPRAEARSVPVLGYRHPDNREILGTEFRSYKGEWLARAHRW